VGDEGEDLPPQFAERAATMMRTARRATDSFRTKHLHWRVMSP
jgi:hypothetical protein